VQISEQWLRTWVDPKLSTEELAHLLTMAGLEVEGIESVAPAFTGVVVAEVLEVAKHPNADRLSVCRVNAGGGQALNIVCGASNVRVGLKVACATIGASLPAQSANEGGKRFDIKPVQMRGVDSEGMLCSARELGLPENADGLLELPADAPVGKDFRAYRALNDKLFTLKLTPNRADCLSIRGVAREVAALTEAALNAVKVVPVPQKIGDKIDVRISSPAGCGRFGGRVIRKVNAKAPTPEWMKDRLARSGQRSISALVDVTNYVMLELGQPLHVYDLDKLQGGIDVRFARKGEKLKLLNEQTVDLDEDSVAIADDSGPIGLGGVMGGDSTKADLETQDIFLEAAFFPPDAIAGRARRYGFASDASHRFERGVDYNGNLEAIERATELILMICGGDPGPVIDEVAQLPVRKPVKVRTARANKIIGLDFSDAQIAGIFKRLGFAAKQSPGVFEITPPSYRFDIEIEEDLIEEIARLHGFDNIPAAAPVVPAQMLPLPDGKRSAHDLRARLAAAGYQEIIAFSFVDEQWEKDFAGNEQPLKLLNPIASQMSVMRSTLIGGLVENARYNTSHKASRVRIFEVGCAYLRSPYTLEGDYSIEGIAQPLRIAGLILGSASPEQWALSERQADFYDVKGDVEALLAPLRASFHKTTHPAFHPGRVARIAIGTDTIGHVGELHPQWQEKYGLSAPAVLFEIDIAPLLSVPVPAHAEVSKAPMVIRDMAFTVDEAIQAEDMLGSLRGLPLKLVQDVLLFDVYRGKGIPKGRKSVAFRVVMQDTARTLTEAEAAEVMARLSAEIIRRHGGEQRM
jgi:phenylalanyl-tRNA synthetase beta chain